MAKNRMNPYGYQIESGKTAIEPQEAEIIRRIYREYAEGLSYLAIATALTETQGRQLCPAHGMTRDVPPDSNLFLFFKSS